MENNVSRFNFQVKYRIEMFNYFLFFPIFSLSFSLSFLSTIKENSSDSKSLAFTRSLALLGQHATRFHLPRLIQYAQLSRSMWALFSRNTSAMFALRLTNVSTDLLVTQYGSLFERVRLVFAWRYSSKIFEKLQLDDSRNQHILIKIEAVLHGWDWIYYG